MFQIQHQWRHQNITLSAPSSMAPMHCYHHIPSDRDQQLEEGVMGVRDVVAQNPAPPPVHLFFVHILVHGKSSSVHFFANLI